MATESSDRNAGGERVVARFRPHARVLFWPSLLLIVGAGALSYFSTSLPEPWMNISLVVGGVIILGFIWVIPFVRWAATRYVITSRRLVLRSGVFTRTRQELLHSRGYDVTVRQGAGQSMFGSGTVVINTGLENPVTLRDVPNAELVQGALHDLMEKNMNPIAARRQAEDSRSDETTAWGSR